MTTQYDKDSVTVYKHPASIIKILTALVAREWVSDAMLDDAVTVTSADMHAPTTAQLQAGDVISWRHLFYGLLVPSGNDAALTLSRVVGERMLLSESATGSPGARFLRAMNDKLAALGFTGAVAGSAHGVDATTALSAQQAVGLMKLAAADAFLREVMGTQVRTMTVTGPNARTYSVSHTVSAIGGGGIPAFPELVCAKSGSYVGGSPVVSAYSVVMLWSDGADREYCTAVLRSPTPEARYTDLRSLIDYALVST